MISIISVPVVYNRKSGSIFYPGQMVNNTQANFNKILKDKSGSISKKILSKHSIINNKNEHKIKCDILVSHDITYVNIIQTALACGLVNFSVPYILTNCHNSLCAVGGTVNRDDHIFGLTAAQKYGGIYVPPNAAVIHQYVREEHAYCGAVIMGSDSHTRYGPLGCMGFGEGGGEIVKQLLEHTYDIVCPEVTGVELTGELPPYCGPHDVALTLLKYVYKNSFMKNRAVEFIGSGISSLSMDSRFGIDTMTTEMAGLTTIWETDDTVKRYFEIHKRADAFTELKADEYAYYDRFIKVDLSKMKPCIALPFNPGNVYTIDEFNTNAHDIIKNIELEYTALNGSAASFSLKRSIENGSLRINQAVIAGCTGGSYENIRAFESILSKANSLYNGISINIYPASIPIYANLIENNTAVSLLNSGAILKPAFCGPCFGSGDIPGSNEISIRHVTRNFINREGSKPECGQACGVALMDARSIAATIINKGVISSAESCRCDVEKHNYRYNSDIYKQKVYNGYSRPISNTELIKGSNIKNWPDFTALKEHLMLYVSLTMTGESITTDDLLPSGELSAYRSNPLKMAEFTLSKKEPEYLQKAKLIKSYSDSLESYSLLDEGVIDGELEQLFIDISKCMTFSGEKDIQKFKSNLSIGSTIFAKSLGEGSAREQAASCQKVLGAWGNIALNYATKRYRTNLINWGIIPFIIIDADLLNIGNLIFIANIRDKLRLCKPFNAFVIGSNGHENIQLTTDPLSETEIEILERGSLINYYKYNLRR